MSDCTHPWRRDGEVLGPCSHPYFTGKDCGAGLENQWDHDAPWTVKPEPWLRKLLVADAAIQADPDPNKALNWSPGEEQWGGEVQPAASNALCVLGIKPRPDVTARGCALHPGPSEGSVHPRTVEKQIHPASGRQEGSAKTNEGQERS